MRFLQLSVCTWPHHIIRCSIFLSLSKCWCEVCVCIVGHVRGNHYEGLGLILDQLLQQKQLRLKPARAYKQTNLFQRSGQFDSLSSADLWPPKAPSEVFILLVILIWTSALTFTQQLTPQKHASYFDPKQKGNYIQLRKRLRDHFGKCLLDVWYWYFFKILFFLNTNTNRGHSTQWDIGRL